MSAKNWVILSGYLTDLSKIVYAQRNGEGCIVYLEVGKDAMRVVLDGVSLEELLECQKTRK